MALTEIKTESEHYYEDDNGLKHGECKSKWKNGKLAIHCHIMNGEFHGEYKSWHENGNQWEHCHYLNSKLHGEYKRWRENGNISQHALYMNGSKVCDLDSLTEEDKILLAIKHGVTIWL